MKTETEHRPAATGASTLGSAPSCTAASALVGEPLAGTAPARRSWLLVEHPGPWGREPLTDAPWPADLGRALAEATTRHGVRMLAVRRHDARPVGGPPERPFVAMSHTGPGGWAVSRRLNSPDQLRTLPLAELAAGRRPDPTSGWADAGPLWGVCTQGTRDTCCARLGRASAHALSELPDQDADRVWEISHSGGHRFAPVLMAWPEGLTYGRVPIDRLAELVAARRAGQVVPELLRGRVHLREPEQAAELAVRSHLRLTSLDAVRVARPPSPARATIDTDIDADPIDTDPPDTDPPDDDRVVTWWDAAGRLWRVEVRREPLSERPPSCGTSAEPATFWDCSTPTPFPR